MVNDPSDAYLSSLEDALEKADALLAALTAIRRENQTLGHDLDSVMADLRTCREENKAIGYDLGLRTQRAKIEEALRMPFNDRTGTLHERLERECWKQHPNDFAVCEEPACELLKRMAALVGWTIYINGVRENNNEVA